jgi:hypothetical protein
MSTPAVHRLRAARPDLSTLPDQEDGRQGTLEGYRRLLARSYCQGNRHGWDLSICELAPWVVVHVTSDQDHTNHMSLLQIVVKSRLVSPCFVIRNLDLGLIASTTLQQAATHQYGSSVQAILQILREEGLSGKSPVYMLDVS